MTSELVVGHVSSPEELVGKFVKRIPDPEKAHAFV
jgi:hypothetical protein